MQVILQDRLTGLYYAGRDVRTSDPLIAFDFRHINHAARHAIDQHLAAMRIVLNYNSPLCQLALPVNPEWVEAEQVQPN